MSNEMVLVENSELVVDGQYRQIIGDNVGDYIAVSNDTDDNRLVQLWIDQKKSKHTQDQYRRVYNHLCCSMNGLPIQAWKLDHLIEWSKFDDEEIATSTKRLRINAMKSLLSFALNVGYTRINVGRLIEAGADNRDVKKKVLTERAISLLLAADATPEAKALIHFLYYTGLRVSEAITVQWEDVHKQIYAYDENGKRTTEHYHVLYVLGKGDKQRTIPLHQSALDSIRGMSDDRTGYVFKSRRANKSGTRTHITRQYANRLIKPIAAAVNDSLDEDDRFVGNVSAHWFRHTNATRQLEKGAPVQDVQHMLGHASLQTTSTYAHSTSRKVHLD